MESRRLLLDNALHLLHRLELLKINNLSRALKMIGGDVVVELMKGNFNATDRTMRGPMRASDEMLVHEPLLLYEFTSLRRTDSQSELTVGKVSGKESSFSRDVTSAGLVFTRDKRVLAFSKMILFKSKSPSPRACVRISLK